MMVSNLKLRNMSISAEARQSIFASFIQNSWGKLWFIRHDYVDDIGREWQKLSEYDSDFRTATEPSTRVQHVQGWLIPRLKEGLRNKMGTTICNGRKR
jgi:hypothetical protein